MRSGILACLLLSTATACGGSDEPQEDQGSPASTTSAASTSGAGGGGGGGETGGGSSCTYPTAQFGLSPGDTLDGEREFQVLAPGKSFGTALKTSSLYDCDGTKGINAIFIKISAAWCGPCFKMSQEIDQLFQTTWQGKGITVEELLVEDVSGGPANLSTAADWRSQTGESSPAYTGIDPGSTFNNSFYPFTTLVDPRTMQILNQDSDTNFVDLSEVADLADKNM